MSGSSVEQALAGKRIGILGCGANNEHLAAWLVGRGFPVTIRDANPDVATQVTERVPILKLATWEVREHILEELDGFDIVFRSPSIPFLAPELQRALQAGITVSSQTKLFFQLCPCEIIGVTGSKGKGTTSTLIANILKAGRKEGATYLAGNIGLDPFSFIDELTENDLVVLELSSFQLTDLHMSPHVAVLLHVTPEHLDHHGTLAHYRAAKQQLLAHQREGDLAIVNAEYPDMAEFLESAPARLLRYTRHTPQQEAAWVEMLDGKEVAFVQQGGGLESIDCTGRRLLGEHNLENILPAILVGLHYGVSPAVIQREVVSFPGLEHRLAHVGRFKGVDFYDDSIATTPESCQVAMEVFAGRRLHLIAGGKDKGQSFNAVAAEIVRRCSSLNLLPGPGTPLLRAAVEKARRELEGEIKVHEAGGQVMESLMSCIHPLLQSGDVVLLAPAMASADPYANYKERGDAFVAAVQSRFGGSA